MPHPGLAPLRSLCIVLQAISRGGPPVCDIYVPAEFMPSTGGMLMEVKRRGRAEGGERHKEFLLHGGAARK